MASDKLNALREKQKQIAEQIRREEARENAKRKKEDTRRKILVGAFILDRASRDEQYNGWLQKSLDGFLVRADDRTLFGLPVLPSSVAAVAPAPVVEPAKTEE